MVTKFDQQAIVATDGIYRAAFPAFRIFIFGQEVSGDVVEVRINHSGGSQDRSPGTCSFTLVNPFDKYIMDHDDMIALGNSRKTLVSTLDQNVQAYKDTLQYLRGACGEDATVLQEFLREISAQPEKYAELTQEIEDAYADLQASKKQYQDFWEEGKVLDNIKHKVVKEKAYKLSGLLEEDLKQYFEKREGAFDPSFYTNFKNFEYTYNFQEGDSIFHPNDPIRIAFRDPFNPRIWYWMFTGFVDSFTEDVGVNQESLLTITGTDVSKMARYSFIQLDTGLLDQSIRDLFANIPAIAGTTAETKFVAFQNLFVGFTVFEILELLFFGQDTFLGSLNETTDRFLAGFSTIDLHVYLMHTLGMSTYDAAALSPKEMRSSLKQFRIENKETRFSGANIPAISTPQGVSFKRRNAKFGTHAFFVGDEIDALDAAIGGKDSHISHGNLKKLNDFLHHRVTVYDPFNMAAPVESMEGAPIVGALKKPEEIITEIGMNPDKYPVGGGRVVYVSPSTLGTKLEKGVLDETVVNAVAMHSEFKDRLSFLYDVAERMEFCCYATPKGDMVFEMPFYDFEPWLFDKEDAHISNAEIQGKVEIDQKKLSSWEETCHYTDEELRHMLGIRTQLELEREGFNLEEEDDEKFSYMDHFTINKHETMGYSNSMNDQGMLTAYRAMPNFFRNYQSGEDRNSKVYEYVSAPGLAPILGLRLGDGTPWGFTQGKEEARLYANLELRRANAEARNIGFQTLPAFGLMVNRPIYWRQRNYLANIVSSQHSIVWNSSCDSTVNVNHVKGWTGSFDADKMEQFTYFGGEMPFNMARLVFAKKGGK